jgi:hypothetical protein
MSKSLAETTLKSQRHRKWIALLSASKKFATTLIPSALTITAMQASATSLKFTVPVSQEVTRKVTG